MALDAEYWDAQATELRRTGLSRIRATAGKWETTLSALLGIFGTVALVEGADKLSKVGFWQAVALTLAAIAAAFFGARAVWNASMAAQGVPAFLKSLTGPVLQEWTFEQATIAADQLAKSRRYAGYALAALFIGFGLSWLLGLPPIRGATEDVNALVIVSGRVECGALVQTNTGLSVRPLNRPATDLAGASQVVPVPNCPR